MAFNFVSVFLLIWHKLTPKLYLNYQKLSVNLQQKKNCCMCFRILIVSNYFDNNFDFSLFLLIVLLNYIQQE